MPCNLYGVNDNFSPENSHVIPALMRKFHEAKENKEPAVTVWGSGKPLREFLNVDDVKKLINTPCKQTDLKNAFIFCCLTGLRFSDISTLNWGKIKKDGNDLCVRFVMQKTQKECVVYISNEAKKWLPKKGKSEDLVFNLANNFNVNKALNKWASNAGVEKNVTFHVARHTAATLNLSLGNSIEVVSEMLGHSSIKTTQISAKVLAESQKRMAAKQNGLFD